MRIQQQYNRVRQASLEMIKPLKNEDFIIQAATFASPAKWNLAHTTWFYEEFILSKYVKSYQRYHPEYAYLFNSYYQAVGDRVARHERGHLSRPAVSDIMNYRVYVDENMNVLLSNPGISKEIEELVILGLNHEQQHEELFYTDLKYNFSVNTLYPAYGKRVYVEDSNSENAGFISIREGIYEIGFNGTGFCFDNEKAGHKVYLQDFEISKQLVTNGEFIEFIESGGYKRFELWHDEGWSWAKENKKDHPLYWHKRDGNWYQYTLAGLRKVRPDDILAHINYFEASAYARYKNMRLPTEFEWEAAAGELAWGKRWEWTESAYQPYPGYRIAEGAVGEYNGKFMVNQKVLRGASVVTPKGHSRKTYRNFFHPHIAYQYNGIRLAK